MKNLRYLTAFALFTLPQVGCAVAPDDTELYGPDAYEQVALGQAQSASAVGLIPCNTPGVHPTSPAGDLWNVRGPGGDIIASSPHACAVIGQIMYDNFNDEMHEVMASQHLMDATGKKPTCGDCMAIQGPPPPPPSNGTTEMPGFILRLSYPTIVETIGEKGTYVAPRAWGSYTLDQSSCPSSVCTDLTSYCKSPTESASERPLYYGRVTNARGWEIEKFGASTTWGDHAYLMEENVGGKMQGAAAGVTPVVTLNEEVHPPIIVASGGYLDRTPRQDSCNANAAQ